VLHQIDNVLLPAAVATVVQTIGQSVMTSPALMRPQLIGSAQQGTIVDFVLNTPSLIFLSTVTVMFHDSLFSIFSQHLHKNIALMFSNILQRTLL
jgi:hypothetical protein